VSFNWLLRSSERRPLGNGDAALDTGSARCRLMDHAWAVRRALAAALSTGEVRRRSGLLDRLAAAQIA